MTQTASTKITARSNGTQDFGDVRRGGPITRISQLSVGQHLVSESKQFDAVNLCEVTKVDSARGIAHAKFVDPLNPTSLRAGASADGFSIWEHELQSQAGSYSLAVMPHRKLSNYIEHPAVGKSGTMKVPSVDEIESLAQRCLADDGWQPNRWFETLVGMSPESFVSEVEGGHKHKLDQRLAARFSGPVGDRMRGDLVEWLSRNRGQENTGAVNLSNSIGQTPAATKLVEVRLSALTRVEYMEVVEVPSNITQAELDDLVNTRYRQVDGGEFTRDPEYWERGTCEAVVSDMPNPTPSMMAFRTEHGLHIERADAAAQTVDSSVPTP